jgi:hypothetical protein
VVGLMPQAMMFSYAPGQPQRKGAGESEVVLDFHPNPTFHPPTQSPASRCELHPLPNSAVCP